MMIENGKFIGLMNLPAEGIEFIGENDDWEAAYRYQKLMDEFDELDDDLHSHVEHDYPNWVECDKRQKQRIEATSGILRFIAEEVDRYLRENELGELLSTDEYIARFGEETYREQY